VEYTLVYSLPRLEQPFGPDQAVTLRLLGHAKLNIQFIYEPGYTGAAYDAGGEPGSDPGAPEFFDFKRITIIDPLVLLSDDGKVRTIMEAGYELSEHLTERELRDIELDLLRRHRAGTGGRRARVRAVEAAR
jgi:hypothetical protein